MKAIRWLDDNFEKIFLIIVTSIMIVIMGGAVFSRYVINISISWAEELSIFGMVYMTYFGASYAVKFRKHIRITIFLDMLSQKNKTLANIANNIIFIAFMVFLIYGTWLMTVAVYETKQVAAASGFPRFLAVGSLPVAFTVMVVRLIQDTLLYLADYRILKAGGTVEERGPSVSIKMEE